MISKMQIITRFCFVVLLVSPVLAMAQRDCFTDFFKKGMSLWKKEHNYEKALKCFNAAINCVDEADTKGNKRIDSALAAIKKLSEERLALEGENVVKARQSIIRSLINQAMVFYSQKQFKTSYITLRGALDSAMAYNFPAYIREIRTILNSKVFYNYFSNFIQFYPEYNLLAVLAHNPDKLYLIDSETFQYVDSIESKEIKPDFIRPYGRLLLMLDKKDSNMVTYDLQARKSFNQPVPGFVINALAPERNITSFNKTTARIAVSRKTNAVIYPEDSSTLRVVNWVAQTSSIINVSPRVIWGGIKADDDDNFIFVFLQNSSHDSSFVRVYDLRDRKDHGTYPVSKFSASAAYSVIPSIINERKVAFYEFENNQVKRQVSSGYAYCGRLRLYDLASQQLDTVMLRPFTNWIEYANRVNNSKPYYVSGRYLVYEASDSAIVFFNTMTMRADSSMNVQLDNSWSVSDETLLEWVDETTFKLIDLRRMAQHVFNGVVDRFGLESYRPELQLSFAQPAGRDNYYLIPSDGTSLFYNLDSGKVTMSAPAETDKYRFSYDRSKVIFEHKGAVTCMDVRTRAMQTLFKLNRSTDENVYFSFIGDDKVLIGINTRVPENMTELEVPDVASCRFYSYSFHTGKIQASVEIKDGWYITAIENNLVALENQYFENNAVWIFMEEPDRQKFMDYFFIKDCRVPLPQPY